MLVSYLGYLTEHIWIPNLLILLCYINKYMKGNFNAQFTNNDDEDDINMFMAKKINDDIPSSDRLAPKVVIGASQSAYMNNNTSVQSNKFQDAQRILGQAGEKMKDKSNYVFSSQVGLLNNNLVKTNHLLGQAIKFESSTPANNEGGSQLSKDRYNNNEFNERKYTDNRPSQVRNNVKNAHDMNEEEYNLSMSQGQKILDQSIDASVKGIGFVKINEESGHPKDEVFEKRVATSILSQGSQKVGPDENDPKTKLYSHILSNLEIDANSLKMFLYT